MKLGDTSVNDSGVVPLGSSSPHLTPLHNHRINTSSPPSWLEEFEKNPSLFDEPTEDQENIGSPLDLNSPASSQRRIIKTRSPRNGAESAEPRAQRKLPEVKPEMVQQQKMRRAQSLSFLPSSDPNGKARRVLPDPEQGRLIKIVQAKMEYEAKARLELAKELKEEKQLRWKAEDELNVLTKRHKDLQTTLRERKEAFTNLLHDFEKEREIHSELDKEIRKKERQIMQLQAEIEKERSFRTTAHEMNEDAEDAIQQAWKFAQKEQALRKEAEAKIAALEAMMEDLRPMSPPGLDM